MLEIVDATKTYHGTPAVRSISFSASPGEVVGLLPPSKGHIQWRGASIHDQLLSYQEIVGYVPEEPKLYGYLTAVEYLELVGGLRHIKPATLKQRIDRYLELFGLSSDVYTPLQSFSKGMRQKVLIAAALLHDPEIIVLDEPNSGLDVASTLIRTKNPTKNSGRRIELRTARSLVLRSVPCSSSFVPFLVLSS